MHTATIIFQLKFYKFILRNKPTSLESKQCRTSNSTFANFLRLCCVVLTKITFVRLAAKWRLKTRLDRSVFYVHIHVLVHVPHSAANKHTPKRAHFTFIVSVRMSDVYLYAYRRAALHNSLIFIAHTTWYSTHPGLNGRKKCQQLSLSVHGMIDTSSKRQANERKSEFTQRVSPHMLNHRRQSIIYHAQYEVMIMTMNKSTRRMMNDAQTCWNLPSSIACVY